MDLTKIEFEEFTCRRRIRLLVKRHCQLAVYASDLEQTFNMIILIQLLMSTLLIGVEGFVFLVCLKARDNMSLMKSLVLVVSVLVQLFLYAYAGDVLESRTAEVAQAAYHSLWYRSRGREAKDLLLIINRGNSPYQMTAGKFFSMNILTFKEIMKTSTSYLSVLKVLLDSNKRLSGSLSILFAEMKSSKSKDFTYTMTPLKLVTWPLGTWPLQDYDTFSIIRAMIVSAFLLLLVVTQYTEMYLNNSNPEMNLDSVILSSCAILAILKVVCFHTWCAGLIANFTSMIADYDDLRSEEERLIVRWHAYMSKVVAACGIFGSYFSATFFMLMATLDKEKEVVNGTKENTENYPILCKYTMEILNLPKSFTVLIFTIEYLMLIVTSSANLGNDALIFDITFHLCGQLKILRLRLTKFINNGDKEREEFNVLIKRHIYLLNLTKMLNESVSSVLMAQLSSCSILICVTEFQFILSLPTANVLMITKTFLVLFTLLTQMFAYCYVGEYLKREMEGIGYTLYFCNWYDTPRNIAKDIVYVIMKTQEPVLLKAGIIFAMNMETSMTIVKTSVSYLSILRLMINV
ncbi:PREDICTED: odorant receptor 33c-like [Eufriesea mexicana]|uniref:odorant receptor 33c-like n=1 Tax=Eufriesea mexicana TaxID=516756 RepID=UPI00083C8988|nr:PREDICTED: odorant receptor 33c-like [Eufriesea mexicana]